ncbi:hypothetical protein [Streptomyces sp. NBC_01190]|uniref:hypothetical protein n=1 Tax=Streptomyces sp. NBC_01190 TaxID=2903767 RepID=UPI0038674BA7|nr:hypothetical protein OG519_23885 [Streptomyces sp. NBC_01190]
MTHIRSDLVLSDSAFHAMINAPLEQVDIADWLLSLPEAEYQRCAPPDHIAAGATTTDDGRPMSLNVEMIGTGLMIQHYVAEIAERDHCHMVSTSDVFTSNGPSRVQVIWDLSAKRTDDTHCEYTNSVLAHPTDEFLAFLHEHGMTFEQAARERQAAGSDHNRRETPNYAASIERAALAR